MRQFDQDQIKERIDTHTLVTNKFIETLKTGIVPWHISKTTAGIPLNLVTKEPYRGINALLLLMAGCEQNLFLTFDQVNALGGKVKAGSKGYPVVKWEKPKNTQGQSNGAEEKSFIKHYSVFNIAQCEIPETAMQALAKPLPLLKADMIAKCMPNCPTITYENREIHYDVVTDTIHIPRLKSRKNEQLHYTMLLHLLVHSTGHDSRLARQGVAEMGELVDRPLFSHEELVATIGSAFLLTRCGMTIEYDSNEAYLNGWIERLQSDKHLIFKAASNAQKAYDYILDIKPRSDQKPQPGA